MARIKLIAGNWKMNKTMAETVVLARELREKLGDVSSLEVLVCPPFTSLAAAVQELRGSRIAVGAQNLHWENAGAFTGEISAPMLREIPVTHVIIGHSERRQLFGETDDGVNRRLKAALAAGLTPIVCVGESLAEREGGQTAAVIDRQVRAGLAGIAPESLRLTVLAYEPVWAIGTGRTATPQQAQDVHAGIRRLLGQLSSPAVAAEVRILYGGSVKPDNARELMSCPDIDGALVGGASLKTADFCGIVLHAA